jgi:hypothetical protein
MPRKHHVPGSWVLALLALLLLLGGCKPSPTPAPGTTDGATRPAQAVRLLTAHRHDNDLVAIARDAVPPALHAQLQTAWRDGRTRWPLDELPFDDRLPALLKSLADPGSEAQLQHVFDRQFSVPGPNSRRPRPRSACSARNTSIVKATTARTSARITRNWSPP